MVYFSLTDLQWVEVQVTTMMNTTIPQVGERMPTLAERDMIVEHINSEAKRLCQVNGIDSRIKFNFNMHIDATDMRFGFSWLVDS